MKEGTESWEPGPISWVPDTGVRWASLLTDSQDPQETFTQKAGLSWGYCRKGTDAEQGRAMASVAWRPQLTGTTQSHCRLPLPARHRMASPIKNPRAPTLNAPSNSEGAAQRGALAGLEGWAR